MDHNSVFCLIIDKLYIFLKASLAMFSILHTSSAHLLFMKLILV